MYKKFLKKYEVLEKGSRQRKMSFNPETDEERNQRLSPKTLVQKIHEKINAKGGLTDKLGLPKLAASEKLYSEDEVIQMIKNSMYLFSEMTKEQFSEEELEKGIKDAFRTGLSVLGLIHGASYIGQHKPLEIQQKESISRLPASEEKQRFSTSNSYRDLENRNFVKAINMSQGSKPMTSKEYDEAIKRADNLFEEYGHHGPHTAYAWNQGPNFRKEYFEFPEHGDYKQTDFVQEYSKNRNKIEKTPYEPIKISDKTSE